MKSHWLLRMNWVMACAMRQVDDWRVEPPAPVHVLPKFIVVVDDHDNVGDWREVICAPTVRVDPVRDTKLVGNILIDYLDFASPMSGLGSKLGLDATIKWPARRSASGDAPFSWMCSSAWMASWRRWSCEVNRAVALVECA